MLSFVVVLFVGCSSLDTTVNDGPEDPGGTGRMQVDPPDVLLTDLTPGYSKSTPFTITDIGDGELVLYEGRIVADPGGVFSFQDIAEDITLLPGQAVTYTIIADLPDATPADGKLRLRTNDPDADVFTLPLAAWPTGYEPADSAAARSDSGATP
jgi:hypothetical protein